MKQFFFNLLESLDKVAGIRQLDKIYAAYKTKEEAKPEINLLLNELCSVCERFDYIPRADMQRIIQDGILTDPEFFGLHGRFIFKCLSKACGAYYKEPVEAVKLPEGVESYEPLTGEARAKWLDEWLNVLKKADDNTKMTFTNASGSKLKANLSELPETKGYKPPTAETVYLMQLHDQYIRENYTPLGEKKANWASELEWEKMQGI
jgi:hypothetical protein